MLATDRFLLVSAGRTGTGALDHWLQEVPGLRIISRFAHERRDVMAAKCIAAGLAVPPAWTIIRNPWAYYLDKWAWEQDKGPCFQGTLEEMLQRTREQPTVEGPFYSLTQIWNILGCDDCEHIGRFENYDEDVVRILRALVPDLLTEEEIRYRITQNRGNGASYLPDGSVQWLSGYREWYSDRAYAWVRELDGELIERFGYVDGES